MCVCVCVCVCVYVCVCVNVVLSFIAFVYKVGLLKDSI